MTSQSLSAPYATPPVKGLAAPNAFGSSSKKYSPAVNWRGKTIYTGSVSLKSELERLFKDTRQANLQVRYEPSIRWGRDARVERLDGSHLIPFELYSDFYPVRDKFFAMLPIEEVHFLQNRGSQWGRGFSTEYRRNALDFAKKEKITIVLGRSCLEGGNCRIFIDGTGKPKAVIGYHSLILSLLALEQQGYFEEHEPELERIMSSIKDPEEDSYRVAKNLVWCLEKLQKCQNQGNEYNSPAPVSDRPIEQVKQPKYRERALEFEAKRTMVKQLIAAELGIREEDIAYLVQEQFHIDLEGMPGPGGLFFLHNEDLALSVLYARAGLNKPHEKGVIEGYLKNANERVDRMRRKFDRNASALKAIQLRVCSVAADFIGTKDEDRVNFANGLLINDRREPRIYTNGTDTEALNLYLKTCFVDQLEIACPALKVIFVHDQTDRMQRNLGITVGGLHCLTYIGGISEPQALPPPAPEAQGPSASSSAASSLPPSAPQLPVHTSFAGVHRSSALTMPSGALGVTVLPNLDPLQSYPPVEIPSTPGPLQSTFSFHPTPVHIQASQMTPAPLSIPLTPDSTDQPFIFKVTPPKDAPSAIGTHSFKPSKSHAKSLLFGSTPSFLRPPVTPGSRNDELHAFTWPEEQPQSPRVSSDSETPDSKENF